MKHLVVRERGKGLGYPEKVEESEGKGTNGDHVVITGSLTHRVDWEIDKT